MGLDLTPATQDPATQNGAMVDGLLAVGTTWVLSLGLWCAAVWASATTLFARGPVPDAQIVLEWATAALAYSAPVAGAVTCCFLGFRSADRGPGSTLFGTWTAISGSCPALILASYLIYVM